MFAKSVEEIFSDEIIKRVIGHGHQVDDGDRGNYEGSIISVDREEPEYSCEEPPESIVVRIKGTCVVQHTDSDGEDHDSDWDIEIEARIIVVPTSHDITSSEIRARINIDIIDIALTSQE
ncbi:hypothetical protein HG421_20745 [Xanthomonas campestris pv. badrii]|uniref:Uncharacterized protein n=1 Tax=Xanthomonas campestris pv. badrii TaxID=149696 RepID=A0A7Z2ZIZ8_XANCA|nr:hypothetical protein [Xanthomonas campestris]QJD69871.1 hypothetical protein HG421_20745 [Xanthomonas campestris pv. badrii]